MVPQRIVVMTDELASKIAAGEVVERPASIVKELVENALDAGADDIRVEIAGGGKTAVKVIDNGEGMTREDAVLSFQRYATSKIKSFDDIYAIHSFGFRGEALPSIASISRIEMLTRRKDRTSGTRLTVEAGKVREVIDAGCPVGTSIIVSDIFYSTPARRKFLKKDITEQGHCIDVAVRSALAHPSVRMTVTSDGREMLSVPKTGGYEERIALIYGSAAMKQSIPVNAANGNIDLQGVISTPAVTRSNTKGIMYFVNGRHIRDGMIHNAIMASYRRLIEAKRFPSVILFITVPPSSIDINVHPAKTEIRFTNPGDVREFIIDALSSALAGHALPPEGEAADPLSRRSDDYTARVKESLRRYSVFSDGRRFHYQEGERVPDRHAGAGGTASSGAAAGKAVDLALFSSLELVAIVAGTYLVFRHGSGLVIIDQHAAHERILYEKLKKAAHAKQSARQELVFPEIIDLTPAEYLVITRHADIFRSMGFDVNPYGDRTVIIKSMPSGVTIPDLASFIHDMVAEIDSTGSSAGFDEIREKLLVLTACRSAVKAHHLLSQAEIENLLKDLDASPNASTCPHGRPLYIRFDTGDLEKMFKRK
ncbi:MAG: DNA mismatch repair endonuclease MutL [Deltaproteobacteria bacterium]|nr:DNA mismatch repair endonuclease MutL [Deltaproteobacteria bacterium]